MAELNDKFEFEQDGKIYNLYDLPDGFVIEGDVDLSYKELTELPDLSKVTVKGDFLCHNNKLTTLQGTPQKVGGEFDCSYNKLTSLTGAPQEVGGHFWCNKNDNLFSLFGLPQMQEDKGIYCDDDLVNRYNCPKSEDDNGDYYIKYKDLIESTKYQSELSVYKILQKKHEERAQNDTARKEKFKAGFEAFMKMQTEERE